MPKVTCPGCKSETAVSLVAVIAPESRMSMTWHPQEGELMSAKGLGGSMLEFAKMMGAIARDLGGTTTTLIEKIHTQEDGSIRADFVILEGRKQKKKK